MRIVAARDGSGCSPGHPEKFHRERFELFQTRILALENLREMVPSLADELAKITRKPKHLMGGKPLFDYVREMLVDCRTRAVMKTRQENLALSPFFRRDEVQRAEAVAVAADELLTKLFDFPGNAEAQPGPREESPDLIGKIPVTGPGANLPGATVSPGEIAKGLTTEKLRHLVEGLLDELEARGEGDTWSATDVGEEALTVA